MLGCPELATDARFARVPDRVGNRELLVPLIQEVLRKQGQAYWCARLDEAGVPNAPIRTVGEAARDPQTEALGIVIREPETGYRMYGLPLSIDGERPRPASRAPELGEHTDELLRPAPAPSTRRR